jgi:molybdopterin converting factor small subunit
VHLCDESGRFRQHVLCFLNDINTRWLEEKSPSLQDGDCITILQAVSGG